MNKISFTYMLLAALLVFAPACGWGIDGTEMLDEKWPIIDGDAELEEEIEAVELEAIEGDTLAGQWLMMVEFTGTILIATLPHPIVIRDLFLVNINEEQTAAELTFCDQIQAITDGFSMGATENPQALKDALGEARFSIEIANAKKVAAQKIAWLWGLKDVSDPINSDIPMTPEDAADKRIWDQDKDDNPGVTVHILAPPGYRYMVRRAIWDMSEGQLSEDGQWIEGTAAITIEQGAMAAVDGEGNPSTLLTSAAPIADDTEVPNEEGKVLPNTYRLRRVSGYDCEKMIANYKGIFLIEDEAAEE